MKLVQSSSGINRIKISKNEWKSIGEKQGWMKEAKLNRNDNIAVMVDASRRGCDISAYKVNPYTGIPVSPEEIAEAQGQGAGEFQQGQVVSQPPPVEMVSKTKRKLMASEN